MFSSCSLEERIVEFCSPTLAGIKTGSLFSYGFYEYKQFENSLRSIKSVLIKKGIEAIPIRCSKQRALIYIFRPSFLEKDFSDKDVSRLLFEFGYDAMDISSCIKCLSEKIQAINTSKEFPHEIGLFLGYPYEDVKGFIEHKGECSKCIGCWKVYGDVPKAKDIFDRYKKCTDEYRARLKKGMTLDQLAVRAMFPKNGGTMNPLPK